MQELLSVKLKHWMLILLGVVAFAMGSSGQWFYPDGAMPPSDIWFMLPIMMLTFAWYRLDSDEREFERSIWLNMGIVALALLALPYYFFRSRGFKRGLVASTLFLLAVLAWGALNLAGQYAILYAFRR